VHTGLCHFDLRHVKLWSLVAILKLAERFDTTFHGDVAELVTVNILVDRPVFKYSLEIFKVHPKDSVIFLFKELKLFANIIRPLVGLVRPIAFPLTASPRVPQLDKSDLVSIFILDLCNRE